MSDTFGNALLGIAFLVTSLASTFLMYKLWAYPFDHQKLRSSAPKKWLLVHHLLGYAYAAIYCYLMVQMVPRLWSYEIEFPARTVAHLILGMTIGVVLFVKIAIVRWFKHLESTLIPFLGTMLLVFTFVLVGLSVPFALRELYLHRSAVGGNAFSKENVERVSGLLPKAGFPEGVDFAALSTVNALEEGRDVLLQKCVQCHDLRTVLLRPRTPQNWVETVRRMASRAVFDPLTEDDQWRVTAYLIAISPELQKSFSLKKDQDFARGESQATSLEAVRVAHSIALMPPVTMELSSARKVFEELCTQCHGLKNLETEPPATKDEAVELVGRMVENGLECTEDELAAVLFYLTETYTK